LWLLAAAETQITAVEAVCWHFERWLNFLMPKAAVSDDAHNLTIKKNISKAGALLHTLVPRAKVFCHYIEQKCVWSSDGGEDFEVLLRMKDGEGVWIETNALFSAAVRYRMMPQIDRWVVSTTIAKLADAKDLVESQGAIFAMNLSGQSIGDDDFGVGLSSFAYLKNFNVDTLKIDGSFIRDITQNRISESMVAAITQVAKVIELSTVAEYVETEEARKLIVKLGVDYAQGHFIAKPVALESTLSALAEVSAA
jgi:EAL domain-containing protein (putative c-di-GMP-specific phosphodiesterase class I)